jgi:hypothetical protein
MEAFDGQICRKEPHRREFGTKGLGSPAPDTYRWSRARVHATSRGAPLPLHFLRVPDGILTRLTRTAERFS